MGSQERGKGRISPYTKWAILVSVLVASALVYGLLMAGSPQRARQLQFDSRRLEDLRQLNSAVNNYYTEEGRLPVELSEIAWSSEEALADPQSGMPYEYEALSDTEYRLCAAFNYSSEEAEASGERYYYERPMPVKADGRAIEGEHPAGRHCWELEAPERGCRLLTDPTTGSVDCFGCARGMCRTAPAGWRPYVRSPGEIGIPYACYESEAGCALAQ